jgi:hypothetical protein
MVTMSLKNLRKLLATASCFVALVTLGHGETYTKIPPLPKITVANFARTNETFDFVTANATGQKTFWAVKLSISSTGNITGSAKVEKYKADGSSDGLPVTVNIAAGSKVYGPNPILPINSTLTDEGNNAKEQIADYRADVILKFANGFVARGKLTYEHSIYFSPEQTTTVNGVTTVKSYYGYDNSDEFPSISVTGPNGHIGFMID